MATNEEIHTLVRSGMLARVAGRYDDALRYLNEAIELCGPHKDYERAQALRELGELARHRHDLESAQAHYQQAVDLMRTSSPPLTLAHTLRHLGDVHVARQQWEQAELSLAEALAIYRNHPTENALDRANAIRAYAVLKTETGPSEEARALWAEAGELYESVGVLAGLDECRRRGAALR